MTTQENRPPESPFPAYQSHKIVHAAKISAIEYVKLDDYGDKEAILSFAPESHIEPMRFGPAFVQKHNPQVGCYLVLYVDGYHSISPAEAFESGYWPLGDVGGVFTVPGLVDFSVALRFAKAGRRIARQGWNGKGMWVEIQRPDSGSKMTLPYLYLNYPVFSETEGVGNPAYPEGSRVPWLASQTDILAEDWYLLD